MRFGYLFTFSLFFLENYFMKILFFFFFFFIPTLLSSRDYSLNHETT